MMHDGSSAAHHPATSTAAHSSCERKKGSLPSRERVGRFMLKIVPRDSHSIAVLDHEACWNEIACTTIVLLRIRTAKQPCCDSLFLINQSTSSYSQQRT